MQVNLEQIVASDKPIRTTWSEEEMQQLVESIKQWGVIQAVKLRPLGGAEPCPSHGFDYDYDCRVCEHKSDNIEPDFIWEAEAPYDHIETETGAMQIVTGGAMFEIVDGHRRIEASRRAGLEYIDATIEGMDDQTALIQSLIANVQREDMLPIDKGKSLYELKEMSKWTKTQIAKSCSKHVTWVTQYLSLYQDTLDSRVIHELIENPDLPVKMMHYEEVVNKVKDRTTKEALLEKVVRDNMNRYDTRKVAEAVKVADDYGDEEAKAALLRTPYDATSDYHEPEVVRDRLEIDRELHTNSAVYRAQENKPPPLDEWKEYPLANVILKTITRWNEEEVPSFVKSAELGNLSPEGQRFLARRVGRLIVTLSNWQNKLENEEYHG
jgi:ParB/RepB/Spo0J family partition protein